MNIIKREARYASVDLLLGSGYLWLARDLNGGIAAYSHKPFKLDDECWRVEEGESKEMWVWVDDGDLYNFVKWEDEEPTNIDEWLKKEEEEMKMYSVKDGELECREVDADLFEKNTTLGGLLASDEVELDRDNKIVTKGVTVVNMNSRNSGKSGILEKAKKIREALEMETKSSSGWELGMKRLGEAIAAPSYEPSVSIVADQFEYSHEPLDVASMYPPLTFEKNPVTHEFICDELRETYEKKNADYGNSFENSLDKHGMIAGIVRMDDKMSRLISLNSKNEQQVMDESMRDTLMDLANYAIMSVMWLDEQ